MKLTPVFSVLMLSMFQTAFPAAVTPWLFDIDANVTLTQNSYSESWIGSEKGAISWASKLNFVTEKQVATFFNHRNTLKLAFGQTKTQDEKHNWSDFVKSTDLIDFETLQRFTLNGWVEPFVAVRLISQFVDEDDSTATHYVNPLDIFESFGISRSLITNNATKWNARLGGALNQRVARYTHDTTHTGGYTKNVNSAGLEFVTELKTKARQGLLDFSSLLTLFEALISTEADKSDGTSRENFWRYPDINWENILSVNLTKYIMINMTVQLLYDRELHANARIKEVLALGLTYKFNNAKAAAPAK